VKYISVYRYFLTSNKCFYRLFTRSSDQIPH